MHFVPRPIIASAVALLLAAPIFAAKRPATKTSDAVPPAPAGFTICAFAKAPNIYSPASMCVSPDGKVFVGEDEYNTGPDRAAGTSRVKLCVDTDGDGVADKFTVFADKLNAPQGLTFVAGTLYVVHAPFLTAIRDVNGDGIADTRRDLIKGLGPIPEGLVHHIPSGLRMGIDGWLYISIGDKGIVKATGADGRSAQLHGGGVVRVRPDGTEMEIFSWRTRNTFDVSVDPLLDTFTRDNTNDGNGWASRVTQMQRDGEYGYPSLFKNYSDEIIQPIGEYGAGSATGTLYVHEPGMPGKTGDSLYTLDWARGICYRNELTRRGATFEATNEEFLKGANPTDIDIDGRSRLFIADWDRRGWGTSTPVGTIYMLAPTDYVAPPFPEMRVAQPNELLVHLMMPSQVRRLEAQREILRRGENAWMVGELKRIVASRAELPARVAAMFTIVQLQGPKCAPTLAEFWRDPSLREFALRALSDRDAFAKVANPSLFAASLGDRDARVRLQAVIGIGHLSRAHLAPQIMPLTIDDDPMVRHAAMQALRKLNAVDACANALATETSPRILAGVVRAMRTMWDPRAVDAIAKFLDTETDPVLRQEAVRALGRLYNVEAPWDGGWWTPHPETRGPNYVATGWEQTPRVGAMLVKLIDDPEPETARVAMSQAAFNGMRESIASLARRIDQPDALRVDAAKAFVQMKSNSAPGLAALSRIVADAAFDPDTRNAAATSLGGIDGFEAQAVVVKLIEKLAVMTDLPAGLLDKACDALALRPSGDSNVPAIAGLLSNSQLTVRAAAATSILRSTDRPAVDAVTAAWASKDAPVLEAMLTAVSRLPVDKIKTYRDRAAILSHDKRQTVRHSAIAALGHIGDAAAVKDLIAIASADADRAAAATALAEIGPDKMPDDQVQPVAKLLVESSTKFTKSDPAKSNKLIAAAQKFLEDKRMPADQKTLLVSQMKLPGVIDSYMRTESLPAPDAKQTFTKIFPPEQTPAGPFVPFSIDGKAVTWTPLQVTDPQGVAKLGMDANTTMYLTANYESPNATGALLSCGSDDGIQVWLNGAKVHAHEEDRVTRADTDKVPVKLVAGKNVLLIKVNNHGDGSGVQARLRWRVSEFAADDLVEAVQTLPGDIARGKALFESVGCVKCHTLDSHEEPKGPFLGGAGSKYDGKYLAESVLKPTAKIAQGFGTEKVLAKDDAGQTSEYIGFVAREAADSLQMRDLTGKVTVVAKPHITERKTLPGSMMPEGLADALTLDDFASLMKFLQSLKDK